MENLGLTPFTLLGSEILRKEIIGSSELQVVKFDPNSQEMSTWVALGPYGYEMKAFMVVSTGGKEVLKSPPYKFLVDNANLRDAMFKMKVTPIIAGSASKGSYSEIMMGAMLHEVSREIVSLVEKNTRDHTTDSGLKLNDPAATQGTNRLIIRTLEEQMGRFSSEWDQAATAALALEKSANLFELPFVIFNDAFPKFEAIENKIRGDGWGEFGCPCGGDKEVLKQASLRGVSSQEVDAVLKKYKPHASVGLKIIPANAIKIIKDFIRDRKLSALEKNFEESWKIGGCCQ